MWQFSSLFSIRAEVTGWALSLLRSLAGLGAGTGAGRSSAGVGLGVGPVGRIGAGSLGRSRGLLLELAEHLLEHVIGEDNEQRTHLAKKIWIDPAKNRVEIGTREVARQVLHGLNVVKGLDAAI